MRSVTRGRAEFSVKEYHYAGSDGKKHTKEEAHYGFRAHIICDVKTELPIAFSVTKANRDEKKEMTGLLSGLGDEIKERAKSIALDRGYDSGELLRLIMGMGISPVADILNCWKDGEAARQYRDTDSVYTYNGEVFYCATNGAMAN